MARETRAQREARWALEVEAQHKANSNAYLSRLMGILEVARSESFELRVENARFVLLDFSTSNAKFSFASAYNEDDWFELDRFEQQLEYRKREHEEQARRVAAKQAALAKLTKEERELLGL